MPYFEKLKSINYLYFFIVAIAYIFCNGYLFNTGDQAEHLPQVYQKLNPELYPNDFFLKAGLSSLNLLLALNGFLLSVFFLNLSSPLGDVFLAEKLLFEPVSLLLLFFLFCIILKYICKSMFIYNSFG
jgi:hypothetical protein